MSNQKLNGEALEQMSVEDLMNLRPDDIAELQGFALPPKGMYSGNLLAVLVPDLTAEPKREWYETIIKPTAVVDLENPEDQEAAQALVDSDQLLKNRWYPGTGVQRLIGEIKGTIDAIAPGEPLGVFFATVNQEGFEFPVNFVVGHRADKKDKTKHYVDLKTINPA